MFDATKIKLGVIGTCLVFAGAYGCGGEDDNKADGSAAGKSSFSVDVKSDSGSATKKAQQDDSAAGKGSWGASIAGDTLMLTLLDADGTTVNAVVKTSETAKMPGTFSVGDEFSDVTVTMLIPMSGGAFTSDSAGTIKFDNCPRAMGEHIKGSFNNIKLKGELDGNAVETLNGTFDVVVYAKAGDLFCNEAVKDTKPGNNGGSNSSPTCQADLCDDGGTCCPYMECMSTCEYHCFTEHCMMNPGSSECFSCAAGCPDSCGVSQDCRNAMGKLMTCEEKAGCDEIEEEDDAMECSKSHCCSELNAVY